jgi:hypothetical protein
MESKALRQGVPQRVKGGAAVHLDPLRAKGGLYFFA